jgi:hypothetical protein
LPFGLFFLVVPQQEAPRLYDGNEMNIYLFTYLSADPYQAQPDLMAPFGNWKARLAGPMISGWMDDQAFRICSKLSQLQAFDPNKVRYGGYDFKMRAIVFGFYHALWLFLLFIVLILYRQDALLIMPLVFSGLMYNFIIPAGKWFYPWDMPTMFFFTWACLLYDKRRFLPLMVVVWLGSLFKETTLCCALLVLLGEHWSCKKRITGFAVTMLVCLLTRKLLMAVYGVHTMLFALNNTGSIHDLIFKTWSVLTDNVQLLFSPTLNHVVFTNTGALVIMMLIPWRNRRDVVFKILAMVFIVGQFLCGIIIEFRIWYEILPLGWMVISETLSSRFPMVLDGQTGSRILQPDSATVHRTNRVMKGSYWLILGALLTVLVAILIVSDLYASKPEEYNKPNQSAAQVDLDSTEGNNLAWMLATSFEATNRNGTLAVELAERACDRTQYRITTLVGTLAAAYAEAGRFEEAISTAEKACALATESGESDLLKRNQKLLLMYRAHLPYREPVVITKPSDSFYR